MGLTSGAMRQLIQLRINGQIYEEEAEPRMLLAFFLRETIRVARVAETRTRQGRQRDIDDRATHGCLGRSLGG